MSDNNCDTLVIIFEVILKEEKKQDYLRLAESLKRILENIPGFIAIERFESLSENGKLLSLSFWRDEQSIEEWRNIQSHRNAQRKGRNYIFENYRLRVVSVIRDYGMNNRDEAPLDSLEFHEEIDVDG